MLIIEKKYLFFAIINIINKEKLFKKFYKLNANLN
jgi:hypothetical protein